MRIAIGMVCAVVMLGSGAAYARDAPLPELRPLERLILEDGKWVHADAGLIVGGEPAVAGEIPWQVGLIIEAGGTTYLCGGTVVAPRLVVTAAHCVEHIRQQDGWSSVTVVSGTIDINQGGSRHIAANGWIHPEYNPRTLQNDIAVLVADLDAAAKPLEPVWAFTTPGLYEAPKLIVSGWGRTSERGQTSIMLLKAEVSVMRNDLCNARQRYDGAVTDAMLCAGGDNGQDSCQGDSGGPLALISPGGGRLVGVVSWGSGCGRPEFPGVYTRTSKFDTWLLGVLAQATQ